jgi:predicted nucleic acid-binding protein
MPQYVLDTNVFVEAYRSRYPMDIAPGFWDQLEQLARSGDIASIEKVKKEMEGNQDRLEGWVNGSLPEGFFLSDEEDEEVLPAYAQVVQWADASSHYKRAAKDRFLQGDRADAWLVANCSTKGGIIVTEETREPDRKSEIKVPDAADPFGVKCVNTVEMMRDLGVRIG